MILDLQIWDWLGIAIAFFVLEIFIAGLFLYWIGLAAITVAIMMLVIPDLDWQAQCLAFALLSIAYVLCWAYFGKSR